MAWLVRDPSASVPIGVAVHPPVPIGVRRTIGVQPVALGVSLGCLSGPISRGAAVRVDIAIAVRRGRRAVSVRVGGAVAVDQMRATAAVAHLYLRHTRAVAVAMLALRGGQEIDEEGEHPEGEDEGNDPLKDGCLLRVPVECQHAEADGQDDFDDDEGQLDPETDAQDASIAEVDPEPLVFRADEDGADDVAGDEK